MKRLLSTVIILCCCIPTFTLAQKRITATQVNSSRSAVSLSDNFKNHALFSINTTEVNQFSKSNAGSALEFELQLPGYATWELSLIENDILSADYVLSVASASGTIKLPKPACMTYVGKIENQINSHVSLTITDNLFYGIVKTSNKEYFIEPLRYFDRTAASDVHVVYETKDVIIDASLTCGVIEMRNHQQRPGDGTTQSAGINCVQSEVAIASDASMYARYGSATAVQEHNIGVMNNVRWDYVNGLLSNNIEMVIVAQNVSTSEPTDQLLPLYNGTNAYTLLPNFRAWGEAGNFGVNFDNGQFWTTKNIDADGAGGSNGVVGLAYIGAVCGSSKYHILEDFAGSNPSGSGYQLRVLTTHEIGHNFGSNHDASGTAYIMAPSVQNTIIWSPESISTIDALVNSSSCFAQCSLAGAPIADFITTSDGVCVGSSMQFVDHSLRGPASWLWNFNGGSPSTSSIRNPTATFLSNGWKNITLTSTNGSGSNTFTKQIFVSNPPTDACSNAAGAGSSNAGIKSFSLGNINKITSGALTDGNKYMDYSCTDISKLDPNTTYTVTVEVGNASNEYNLVQLFIDYNNDGDFNDASESVYSSPSCYIGKHQFSFTTPSSVTTNQFLRARVMAKDCVGGVNSCYAVTFGQVEDYGVYFQGNVTMPVTLLNFNGIHQNGRNMLNWRTSSEINHDYFDLERSINGIDFASIGRVHGSGNSSTIRSYSFIDGLINAGSHPTYYYRLKNVDLDGSFTYSTIVVLDVVSSGKAIVVYPNPVLKGGMIQVNLQSVKASRIEILNGIGQLVHSVSEGILAGNVGINLPRSLTSGQYIIRIITGGEVFTEKLIIK